VCKIATRQTCNLRAAAEPTARLHWERLSVQWKVGAAQVPTRRFAPDELTECDEVICSVTVRDEWRSRRLAYDGMPFVARFRERDDIVRMSRPAYDDPTAKAAIVAFGTMVLGVDRRKSSRMTARAAG
jgi:hypothetical protein